MYQRVQSIEAFKPFCSARNIFTMDVKNQLIYLYDEQLTMVNSIKYVRRISTLFCMEQRNFP